VGAGAFLATLTSAPVPPKDRGLAGAARHGVTNLAGVGVAAVLAFALNVVVARGFARADAGLFFAVTSAFMITYTAARLGTGVGTVYFVSRYRALGQPQRIRAVLVAATLPVLAIGMALGVVGWVAAPWLAAQFQGASADAVPMVRAVSLFIPVAAVADTALAACRGFGAMRPLLLVERFGRLVVQFIAVGLVTWMSASVTTALPLAWAGPYLPAAVVAVVWLGSLVRRAERAASSPPGGIRDELWPFWKYTAPRSLAALAQAAVQRLGVVLVAALRSTSDAAVFTAATRFMSLGQLCAQAVATAVQHRVAERITLGDMRGVSRLYQATTGWVILLAWPAYLLFATYAEPVLTLFGPQYTAGRDVTVVLALTMLVATGCGMVDTVLNMAGRTAWTFYNALAAVIVNVGLDLLLIPRFGIVGAAVAWSAAILLNNLVPLYQLHRSMGLHPYGRGTAVAACLALACFGVPTLAVRFAGGGLAALVVATVVGAAVYVVAAWRLRRPLDLDGLQAVRRRGRRSADSANCPAA
jgi:O-antigen/teichoic acid export membrane protein